MPGIKYENGTLPWQETLIKLFHKTVTFKTLKTRIKCYSRTYLLNVLRGHLCGKVDIAIKVRLYVQFSKKCTEQKNIEKRYDL